MLTESLNIYVIDKDGNKVTFPNVEGMQPAIVDVNLNRERMAGAPTNTSTLMYPVCLDSYWTKKEFIEIGSERYYVKQVPTSEKNTEDTRYKHEITFVSERDILENVFFFDCVTQDTSSQISDKPRSNTTDFSFYGDLNELVQRLNDSLSYSKIYDPKGENGFCIVIDDDVEIGEAKEVSMTDAYFATAMQEIYNVFEVPYYWVGKICHVGYQENEITEPFEYGSGNGLISVQKTNAEFRLINRITGQGGADNIPYYYPNTDPNGEPILTIKNMDRANIKSIQLTTINAKFGGSVGKTFCLGNIKEKNATTELFNDDTTLNGIAKYAAPYEGEDEGGNYYTEDPVDSQEEQLPMILEFEFYAYVNDFIDMTELSINTSYEIDGASTTIDFDKAKQYQWGTSMSTPIKGWDAFVKIIMPDGYEEIITANDTTYRCKKQGVHKLIINCTPSYRVSMHPASKPGALSWASVFWYCNIRGSIKFKTFYGDVIYQNGKVFKIGESGISIIGDNLPKLDLVLQPSQDYGSFDAHIIGGSIATCAQFTITGIDFINPISKLMPYVYREKKGAERFYNAKNGTYLDDNGNYYSFNNPYVPSEPLEGKQDFEDIKPTINGITNAQGQLFGEVADIAFDETDSDDLAIKDKDDNTANLVHSYFYIKLHKFDGDYGFNLFKQGLSKGAMTLNFISGSCAGCAFEVGVSKPSQVDNHYEFKNPVQVDELGNIVAGDYDDKVKEGNPIESQQDTTANEVWIALKKDQSTFGVVMPNATNNYRPKAGDKFVITNILLPQVYITAAEKRLDAALIKYMSENNDEKFTFSIKFSRIYLQEHPEIAEKINENTKLHVKYNNVDYPLFVSSYSRKSDDNILDEISVELSEKLTIAQNKSKEQMDSIMGNVNEQINNAINGSNGGGSTISAADINEIKTSLNNKLSRVSDDTANGKITFQSGANFGAFTSGTLGTGGNIDYRGNAELDSLFIRRFLSVPKFVFNQVNITASEQWNTNAYGTIESVDTEKQQITLRLESNEYGLLMVGDICRGIFADIENAYGSDKNTEGELDDCGFTIHRGFFTTYFYVKRIITNQRGKFVFEYGKRSDVTPDPCAFMDFAQYGNFTDESRQSSMYFSSRGKTYTEVLDGVKTWDIQPANRAARFGWLGNLTLEKKDGTTINLKDGNGLYVQKNIYFGGTVEHLDGLKEVDDLKELATSYDVTLSQYQSVITVDDMGNVINGLYTEDEAKTTKQYRISTAVFVRKGSEILLEEDSETEVVTEGHYRLHVVSEDCDVEVRNSTVFVKGIRNIKDGVSGTEDDATFDYDTMRRMSDATVLVVVDLEGKTTKTVEMPIRIQHDSLPFMVCDISNENASVAWNTKTKKYLGLPIKTTVNLMYHNEPWLISECKVVGGVPEGLTATVALNENGKSYDITISGSPTDDTLPQVSNIVITVVGRYAGANYEYTKTLTINKSADNVIYEIVPSADSIVIDKDDNMSASYLTCDIYATSSDDKRYKLTALPEGFALKYGIDTDVPTTAMQINGTVNVSSGNNQVVFALYDKSGNILDKESVPLLAYGKDGKGIEYVFKRTTDDEIPSISTPSDWATNTEYQRQDKEYVPTGWTDDPVGVNEVYLYEWVATRKSVNGVWQPFGDVSEYAHFGKHAARATVTDNIVTIPTDSEGKALASFSEYIYFSLLVDGLACSIDSISTSDSLDYASCVIDKDNGRVQISCNDNAALGKSAQTLNFKVVGTLNGATYQDSVTVKVIPNVTGEDGDGYEYIYYLCDESYTPKSKPTRSKGILSSENGIQWVDDVPEMTGTNRYIYVAWKNGEVGSDGTFSLPKLYTYKAKDGVGEVSAYQMVETMPTLKPTTVDYETFSNPNTNDLGNGWTKQIVKQGAKMVLGGTVMNVSGNNNVSETGGNWSSYSEDGYIWWKSPNGEAIGHNGTASMEISFTTSEDNMRVTFYLKASSETADKIALSKLDSDTINSSTAIGGNGVSSGAIYFDVEKAGTHYVTVQYRKDYSISSYGDFGLVRMATNECYVLRYPPIYRCHGKVTNNDIAWGDIIKETGDQGEKGDKGDKGDQGDKGNRGYNGCIFRTSIWKTGVEYHNDTDLKKDDDKYIDIVYVANSGTDTGWDAYKCTQTHTSGSTMGSNWEKLSGVGPIYTPLILAKNAVLELAQSQEIHIYNNEAGSLFGCFKYTNLKSDFALWLGASVGNQAPFGVTAGGKVIATNAVIKGEITATKGTFDKCVINDTCTITKIDAVKGTIAGLQIADSSISATTSTGTMNLTSNGLELLKGNYYARIGTWTYNDVISGTTKTIPNIAVGGVNSSGGLVDVFIATSEGVFMNTKHVQLLSLPTSSTGLKIGEIYNDNGTLKIK